MKQWKISIMLLLLISLLTQADMALAVNDSTNTTTSATNNVAVQCTSYNDEKVDTSISPSSGYLAECDANRALIGIQASVSTKQQNLYCAKIECNFATGSNETLTVVQS
jgi:hypothetical protein